MLIPGSVEPPRARGVSDPGSDTAGIGAEGLGRCTSDANRLAWTLPRLSGQTTVGPFGAVLDISGVKPGSFNVVVSVPQEGVLAQEVPLERP